ncbi:uncharacterized protein VTP21DRAFT_8491 [Calcarisporiella thermophila]|uniref:uncharacterized protein n=1 Tax=Calcarisporiella thermophila TaxID=911321 RepID=UPI003742E57C
MDWMLPDNRRNRRSHFRPNPAMFPSNPHHPLPPPPPPGFVPVHSFLIPGHPPPPPPPQTLHQGLNPISSTVIIEEDQEDEDELGPDRVEVIEDDDPLLQPKGDDLSSAKIEGEGVDEEKVGEDRGKVANKERKTVKSALKKMTGRKQANIKSEVGDSEEEKGRFENDYDLPLKKMRGGWEERKKMEENEEMEVSARWEKVDSRHLARVMEDRYGRSARRNHPPLRRRSHSAVRSDDISRLEEELDHYRELLASKESEMHKLHEVYTSRNRMSHKQAQVIKLYRYLVANKNEELNDLRDRVDGLVWKLDRIRREFTRERERLTKRMRDNVEYETVPSRLDRKYHRRRRSESEVQPLKEGDRAEGENAGRKKVTLQTTPTLHMDEKREAIRNSRMAEPEIEGANEPAERQPQHQSPTNKQSISTQTVNPQQILENEVQLARRELLILADLTPSPEDRLSSSKAAVSTQAEPPLLSMPAENPLSPQKGYLSSISNDLLIVKARDKILGLVSEVDRLQTMVQQMAQRGGTLAQQRLQRFLPQQKTTPPTPPPFVETKHEEAELALTPPATSSEETYRPPSVFRGRRPFGPKMNGDSHHAFFGPTTSPRTAPNGDVTPRATTATERMEIGNGDRNGFTPEHRRAGLLICLFFLLVLNAGFLRAWGIL